MGKGDGFGVAVAGDVMLVAWPWNMAGSISSQQWQCNQGSTCSLLNHGAVAWSCVQWLLQYHDLLLK